MRKENLIAIFNLRIYTDRKIYTEVVKRIRLLHLLHAYRLLSQSE